jgi:membrane protein involved in colicin uptake
MQQIKEEFQRRKALRDARTKLNAAIVDANRIKTVEEIAAEVKAANERRAQDEAEAEKKKMLDELAARSARKAALNAKWSGGAPKTPGGTLLD